MQRDTDTKRYVQKELCFATRMATHKYTDSMFDQCDAHQYLCFGRVRTCNAFACLLLNRLESIEMECSWIQMCMGNIERAARQSLGVSCMFVKNRN